MRLFSKIIVALAVNSLGLIAAARWVPGFDLKGGFLSVLWVGLTLTALNFIVKPILKLILGPVIILTLGLGLVLINAIVLYILDILSADLTIQGIAPLIYASLVIGAVNFIFHLAAKDT